MASQSPVPHHIQTLSPARRSLRARIEAALLRHWYPDNAKKTWLAWLLLPASTLFASFARRKCARSRRLLAFDAQRSVDAVVVVVGNITTGGTGKTPLLLELASRLIQQGYRIAVLSKGYGGNHLRAGGPPRLVAGSDSSALVGDEPLLLARALAELQAQYQHTQAGGKILPPPVVICRDRAAGLQWLLQRETAHERQHELLSGTGQPVVDEAQAGLDDAQAGLDIVLCDDGLQHYALPRDLEYIVIDAQRGFGNGCLLPAGPLREPLARLALADQLVLNGGELRGGVDARRELAGRVCSMQVVSAGAQRLGVGTASEVTAAAPPREALAAVLAGVDSAIAVTGTGNPARFFAGLAQCSPATELHTAIFPDHHHFSEADFLGLLEQYGPNRQAEPKLPPPRRAFFVTGKDAVKCAGFADRLPLPIYAVGIEVELPDEAMQPILLACGQLQAWRERKVANRG